MQYNEFNQPIGEPLPAFTAGKMPDVERIDGRFCRLEHLSVAKHSEDLWRVHNSKTNPQNWTYLPPNYGPFAEKTDFLAFLTQQANAQDPYCFAIIDQTTNQAMGSFSLMRIDSSNRVIEVGAVIYSEALKRSKIATEAQFLLAQYVFETLQYRRYEWKCDSLN
ncbi:GNAT family N-acetyltransferase [Rodentibacter caecimuris]|nr:GNAT family protein [Rodentibacter heylii]